MNTELVVRPDELGVVPEDWPIVRVGDVFGVQQGKQVSKRTREGPNQRPFLRTRNVLWGRIDATDLDEMNFTAAEATRLALHDGDLLICEGGETGRTAIWRGEVDDCYYQNHLHRLRARDESVDPEFALYWFWYAFRIGRVYYGRGNVTTIPNLSQSAVRALPMPLPEFEEQRRIATALRTIEVAAGVQSQLVQTTAELKNAALTTLFTRGVSHAEVVESEAGRVPAHWTVAPLGDYLDTAQYGTSAKGSLDGATPLIRMTNQRHGQIVADDLQYVDLPQSELTSFGLDRGDVLFNRTNSLELVGRTALFDLPGQFVFASYLVRLVCDGTRLRSRFLNHYLNWNATQQRLKSIATRAVSQSNISAARLRKFYVAVPPMEEQDAISDRVTLLDEKIALHERQMSLLEELFRAVMHDLMTGRRRLHESTTEAAVLAG